MPAFVEIRDFVFRVHGTDCLTVLENPLILDQLEGIFRRPRTRTVDSGNRPDFLFGLVRAFDFRERVAVGSRRYQLSI